MRHRLLDWVHALPYRVATKFAVALTGGALVALALVVTVFALHERREVISAATSDLQSQGDALAPVLEEVWAREGEGRAREILRAADAANGSVSLRIAAATARPQTDDRVFALVPLPHAEGGAGHALVLETDKPRLGSAFGEALRAFILAAIPLALFALLTAYALGEWLVGAPLRRVVERAQRIGDGDLDERLLVRGSAEIASLTQAVNAMSDDLRRAHARAREEEARRLEAVNRLRHVDRLTTVGTLAAGIAHELGTPLNVILLESRSIERTAHDPLRVERGAQLIRNQAGRMTAIVRQLLDFARRKEPVRTLEDATDVVSAAAVLVASLARTRGCAVDVVGPEGGVAVCVDSCGIQQVLTNLFVNAFDAMPNGGPVLARVTRTAGRSPRGDAEREWVCIEVVDAGVGMDAATRARVFEPFFTTKDVGAGTGLGLSVALGITEDHGGYIEVRAAAATGTVFAVYLPFDGKPALSRAAFVAPLSERAKSATLASVA